MVFFLTLTKVGDKVVFGEFRDGEMSLEGGALHSSVLSCKNKKKNKSVLEESLEKTELRLQASAFNLWLAAFSF